MNIPWRKNFYLSCATVHVPSSCARNSKMEKCGSLQGRLLQISTYEAHLGSFRRILCLWGKQNHFPSVWLSIRTFFLVGHRWACGSLRVRFFGLDFVLSFLHWLLSLSFLANVLLTIILTV